MRIPFFHFFSFFFSLLLSLSFFLSPLPLLSFPSLLHTNENEQNEKGRVYLFIRSKGLRTSMLMTGAYCSCVKHVGRQRTGRRYGKKFGVIARDDDSIWFPSFLSLYPRRKSWLILTLSPLLKSSAIRRTRRNSFSSLSFFQRGIFKRFRFILFPDIALRIVLNILRRNLG